MKADGGALLYIIIAVVSLIVSAINQSNKKKRTVMPTEPGPAPEAEEHRPSPQRTWQEELEEIFGKDITHPEEKRQEKPIPETRPQKVLEPEISYTPEINPVYEAKEELKGADRGEIYSTVDRAVSSLESDKSVGSVVHEEENDFEPVVLEGFELRKAIIYNEVLNHKYF